MLPRLNGACVRGVARTGVAKETSERGRFAHRGRKPPGRRRIVAIRSAFSVMLAPHPPVWCGPSASPLPSQSAGRQFHAMRLSRALRSLALAAGLAACGRGGDANVGVNMAGPARGADDLAINTIEGYITLAVRADSIRMRMSKSFAPADAEKFVALVKTKIRK